MTDFLRSDWSLWPVLVWVVVMLCWRAVLTMRRRSEDRDWAASYLQLPHEHRPDEGEQALALLQDRAARDARRRRLDLVFVVVSAFVVVLAAVRLPFAVGWA